MSILTLISKMNTFIVLAFCVAAISAHANYRDMIPNGYSVPNPCGAGTWEAVGHFDPHHHTIQKNAFGQAFAAAGRTWTAALCNADSDGDGKTNGEELGDPTCTWTMGGQPAQSASGHPGICNPVGSCAGDSFSCGCHGNQCVGK